MPAPRPHKGESRDDFIGRCMSDDVMKREKPDQQQRLGMCFGIWNGKKLEDLRQADMRLLGELADAMNREDR